MKVILGFVELALSLKFLSVADLAYGWHILDREVFIALWVAIFVCLGLYLLRIIRFFGDSDKTHIGALRLMAVTPLVLNSMMISGKPIKSLLSVGSDIGLQLRHERRGLRLLNAVAEGQREGGVEYLVHNIEGQVGNGHFDGR